MPSKTKDKRKVKGKSKKARRQLRNTRVSGASKWRKWKSRGLARATYFAKSQQINPEPPPKTTPVKTKTSRTSKITRTKRNTKTHPSTNTHPKNIFSITNNPMN